MLLAKLHGGVTLLPAEVSVGSPAPSKKVRLWFRWMVGSQRGRGLHHPQTPSHRCLWEGFRQLEWVFETKDFMREVSCSAVVWSIVEPFCYWYHAIRLYHTVRQYHTVWLPSKFAIWVSQKTTYCTVTVHVTALTWRWLHSNLPLNESKPNYNVFTVR